MAYQESPSTTAREQPLTHSEARDVGADEPRARVVERHSWRPAGVGPGFVLGLTSGIGLIVSMFLPWREPSMHPDDVPLEFLWDQASAAHHPSLLLALIPLAGLLVVGALVPRGSGMRLLGGVGTLVVAALFAVQLNRLVDDLPGAGDLGDALDVGFYVAAIAGLLGLASGFMPGAWARRRTVDYYDGREDADPDMWDRRRRR